MEKKVIVSESVEDILRTPVQDLRKDQIDFLRKIVNFDETRKKSFWKKLGLVAGMAVTFGLAVCAFVSPVSVLSVAGAIACIGSLPVETMFLNKVIKESDYTQLGTNGWTYEDFLLNNGVERVKSKLNEVSHYEEDKFLKSLNINPEKYPERKTNEVANTIVIDPIETTTTKEVK